jgi:hypothetical protein
MMLARAFVVDRVRRRRWLHTVERWGPERCSVDTLAIIVGTDAATMVGVLEKGLHRPLAASTVLSKSEILAGLRH